MSEKASKGYDPTQARMVGNILAGDFCKSFTQEVRVNEAISLTNLVLKKLKKQFKEEESE